MLKELVADICRSNPNLFLDMPIFIGGNFYEEPKSLVVKIMDSSF